MTRKLWLVIKWFFSYHGMSKPPTQAQLLGWTRLGKAVIEKKCRVCQRKFWTVRETQVCPRLHCYLVWHGGYNGDKGKHKEHTRA